MKGKDRFITTLLDKLYLNVKGNHVGVAVRLLAEIVWQLNEIIKLLKKKKGKK